MNRRKSRMQQIHKSFTDGLRNDVKPYTEREREVLTAFLKDVNEKKAQGINVYPRVLGVYGEWDGADGFVEKVIPATETDGPYLKLWGNSFLFKAPLERTRMKYLDLGKYIVLRMPLDIGVKYLGVPLAFMAIFQRRKFIRMCDAIVNEVIERNVKQIEPSEESYHRCARELKRAASVALEADNYGFLRPLLEKLIHFVIFFLESDTAYMFRIQDAFGAANGFWDGLNTLLEREVDQRFKWKYIKTGLKLFLWRYPEVRRFIDAFFEELDNAEIAMDEADRYFSLTYSSYNFGGRTKADRFAERERIDREREHVFIKI